MFTGLVEEVGRIAAVKPQGTIIALTVEAAVVLDGIRVGDSIAVSGPCLTVTAFNGPTFTVQAVAETLRRTTLARKHPGDGVNLERSLRLGDRLGGHLVQGHVDGIARIVSRRGTAENIEFAFAPGTALERYIAGKGSITIDGVSLTVTHAVPGEFGVSVIPHTLGETTLGDMRPGDEVNIETDVIARYVEKLMGGGDALTMDRLRDLGF